VIWISLALVGCSSGGEVRLADCIASQEEAVSLDEPHPDHGFSAREAIGQLTSQVSTSAEVFASGQRVDVDVVVSSLAASDEARLVTYDIGDECPVGRVLQVDIELLTEGTIAGFEVTGTRLATVDFVGLQAEDITFPEDSVAVAGSVDDGLRIAVLSIDEKAGFDAPADAWSWYLGPMARKRYDWSQSLRRTDLMVKIDRPDAEPAYHVLLSFDGRPEDPDQTGVDTE